MFIRWHDLPTEELEPAFNPRLASKDAQGSLDRYARRSAEARAFLSTASRVTADLRYGPGPLQTLDLYQPQDGASSDRPLVVFIHGGFWRALDKLDHSFVVPPLVGTGAVVVNFNYDLCPQVTLDEMSAQIISGVRYCHGNAGDWGASPQRLILIGHSAGAHLAARVLNEPAAAEGRPADLVAGLAAISGIYEPEVVLHLSVNEEAQITPEVAARNDCVQVAPAGNARIIAWAGAGEPRGWIDQSRLYVETARASGLACEFFEHPATDHFTVLERSFEPGTPGWQAIGRLLDDAQP